MDSNKLIRLNKYLAHAGIGNRRKCDEFIQEGLVKVNGELIQQAGVKISLTDKVTFRGEEVQAEKKVYILLNKPKNISSLHTEELKSIFYLTKSFILKLNLEYSIQLEAIDILDIDERGLTLLTNDKSLLEDSEYNSEQVFRLKLNKELTKDDVYKIQKGFEIKSGSFKAKELIFLDENDKSSIGITLNIKDSKALNNLFNKLSYKILYLDRTLFYRLSKKDLPRGRWRFLDTKEIQRVKYKF